VVCLPLAFGRRPRSAFLVAVRRKREARYGRFVRPLDRKRDELVADVSARVKALSSGQYAEAQRMLRAIAGPTSTAQRATEPGPVGGDTSGEIARQPVTRAEARRAAWST